MDYPEIAAGPWRCREPLDDWSGGGTFKPGTSSELQQTA
jgi:hypothetical protein